MIPPDVGMIQMTYHNSGGLVELKLYARNGALIFNADFPCIDTYYDDEVDLRDPNAYEANTRCVETNLEEGERIVGAYFRSY